MLARRIGANELDAIDVCRDYVGMQQEYARHPHDGKPAGLFAQRLRSSPGREDGLYWHRKFGGKLSPLSALIAEGTAEGYDLNKPESSAFRGYHFRILTAQGPAAPGGKKSYVTNGAMKGGFALLAYPDKYAYSGVMTFVVRQDGVVYQKDLGEDTATQALSLAEYDPDESWTAVRVPLALFVGERENALKLATRTTKLQSRRFSRTASRKTQHYLRKFRPHLEDTA